MLHLCVTECVGLQCFVIEFVKTHSENETKNSKDHNAGSAQQSREASSITNGLMKVGIFGRQLS